MNRHLKPNLTTVVFLACLPAITPVAAQQRSESPGTTADRVLSVRSLVGADAPQWSPDGGRLTFMSSLGGGSGLWSVSAEGGFPTPLVADLGGVPFLTAQSPRWSPTGEWIAYVSNKGGPAAPSDQPGPTDIWLWSAQNAQEVQLTRLGARVGSFSWSPDGKWIAFSGGAGGNYDIWKVSVPSGEVSRLTSDDRYEVTPTWAPDGTKIVYSRLDDRWVDHEIMEMGADGRGQRLIIQETDFFDYNTAGTPAFGPPVISPDGRLLLFRSWRSGWVNYWMVPVAGGEPRALTPESADQDRALWSPDGRFIAYSSNHDGTHDLRVVPAGGGAPRVLVAPKLGVVSNFAWSPDGKRLTYLLTTPTRAADLYVVSLQDGTSKQLTFSAPGGNVEASLVIPEKITYRSDSLTIHAYLYRPPASRPGERLPAIVFAHGGPTSQYNDTYDAQMQFFVRQGYVVLAPNFRGGSGYGRAFADLNNKCWAHCDLKDLVAGAQYLRTLPYVSATAIGITGTSHGGLLSMAAATFAPGVFQASIPHGGTADRIYYYNTQELRHIKQAENEFGPLKGNEEVYRYVSPFYFAREVNTPMFVVWGEGKWPGSENSKRYVAELERNYKVLRSKVYSGENYYVSSRGNARQLLLDMLDFFDQYLKTSVAGPAAATTFGRQ
ncbi:MAG: S9 family peptidase [Gemmatimonadetes bacterium]|nr:S9 family peptidase [Gemmatimonadota bacterium]